MALVAAEQRHRFESRVHLQSYLRTRNFCPPSETLPGSVCGQSEVSRLHYRLMQAPHASWLRLFLGLYSSDTCIESARFSSHVA